MHRKKNILKSVPTLSFCLISLILLYYMLILLSGVINLIPFILVRKAFGEAFRIVGLDRR